MGGLSPVVECTKHDGDTQAQMAPDSDLFIRCLGVMGLWGRVAAGMVPAPVGGRMDIPSHCSKRVGAHCSDMCHVGFQ